MSLNPSSTLPVHEQQQQHEETPTSSTSNSSSSLHNTLEVDSPFCLHTLPSQHHTKATTDEDRAMVGSCTSTITKLRDEPPQHHLSLSSQPTEEDVSTFAAAAAVVTFSQQQQQHKKAHHYSPPPARVARPLSSRSKNSSFKFSSSKSSSKTCMHRCFSNYHLSFRTTLAALCALLICVACVLCWYVGQNASAQLVTKLSARQREYTLGSIGMTVHFELQKSIRMVGILTGILAMRGTNDRSIFVAMDSILRTFEGGYVQLLGYATKNNFYAHLSNAFDPQPTNQTYEFAWMKDNVTGHMDFYRVDLPLVDPLVPFAGSLPVLKGSLSDVAAALAPVQLANYGRPVYKNITNYTPTTRPWYLTGKNANGSLAWTAPYKLLGAQSSVTVISTVQQIIDPFGVQQGVAYSIAYLSHITTAMQAQESVLGPNGMVFMIDESGLLLAASQTQYVSLQGSVKLCESNITLLEAVAEGINIPGIQNLATWPGLDGYAISSHGSYHLSASTITVPGLTLIVAVLTYDNDWNDDIRITTRNTALVSAAILIFAIATMIVTTRWMSRPLSVLTEYMVLFGNAVVATTERTEMIKRELEGKDNNGFVTIVRRHSGKVGSSGGGSSSGPPTTGTDTADTGTGKNTNQTIMMMTPPGPSFRNATDKTPQSLYRSGTELQAVGTTIMTHPPAPVQQKQHSRTTTSSTSSSTSPSSRTRPVEQNLDLLYKRWRHALDRIVPKTKRRTPMMMSREVGGNDSSMALASVFDLPPSESHVIDAHDGSENTSASNSDSDIEDDLDTSSPLDRSRSFQFRMMEEMSVLCHSFDVMFRQWRTMYSVLQQQKEAKRQFIRYIFHEIRVPLSALVLAVDHLEGAELSHELKDVVSMLQEQGSVMSRVLNDVLCFQQMEDGAMKLEMEAFDIGALILSTIHTFSAPIASKQIEVRWKIMKVEEMMQRGGGRGGRSGGGQQQVSQQEQVQQKNGETNEQDGVAPPAASNNNSSSPPSSQPPPPLSPPPNYQVLADRLRIKQVLSNFISNAIKFTPVGGKITVLLTGQVMQQPQIQMRNGKQQQQASSTSPSLQRTTSDTNNNNTTSVPQQRRSSFSAPSTNPPSSFIQVRLSVRDTGCGMSSEAVGRMFQQYSMVKTDRTDATKLGSSGLGLSICKRLVELHQGHVGCTSQVNVGSEFFCVLPLEVVTAIPSSNGSAAPPLSSSSLQQQQQASTESPKFICQDSLIISPMSTAMSDGFLTLPVAAHFTARTLSAPAAFEPSLPASLFTIGLSACVSPTAPMTNLNIAAAESCVASCDLTNGSAPALAVASPLEVASSSSPSTKADPTSCITTTLARRSPPPIQVHPIIIPAQSLNSPIPPSPLSATTPLTPVSPSTLELLPIRPVVLVVEDSLPNRKLLLLTLKSLGWPCEGLNDGQAVVDYFRKLEKQRSEHEQENGAAASSCPWVCPVCIVLMDNTMPLLSGIEATREIRAMQFSLPIVGVTGDALADDISKFLGAGANEVLPKPINKQKLKDLLGRVVKKQTTPSSASTAASTPTPATSASTAIAATHTNGRAIPSATHSASSS